MQSGGDILKKGMSGQHYYSDIIATGKEGNTVKVVGHDVLGGVVGGGGGLVRGSGIVDKRNVTRLQLLGQARKRSEILMPVNEQIRFVCTEVLPCIPQSNCEFVIACCISEIIESKLTVIGMSPGGLVAHIQERTSGGSIHAGSCRRARTPRSEPQSFDVCDWNTILARIHL